MSPRAMGTGVIVPVTASSPEPKVTVVHPSRAATTRANSDATTSTPARLSVSAK